MRYVRTTRGSSAEELVYKSRLIIPGHRDPQLGLYRTDAPTTSGLAVLTCAAIAASLEWPGEVFDVHTAFLSGKPIDREVYVRAPKEGLGGNETDKVRPYALLRLLKGAYGLTEAPRLWYLRARELLHDIGFEEIKCARAVFTLREASNRVVAFLTLHVDDGMLYGDRTSQCYLDARAEIDKVFSIKAWKKLSKDKRESYLGMQWRQDDEGLHVDMDEYIRGLEAVPVNRTEDEDRKLGAMECHEYRSALAKLRWPVAHVLPELAYGVSRLAQHNVENITIGEMRKLNGLIQEAKKIQREGGAQLHLRKVELSKLLVLTPFDASYAKEPGSKSQSGFMNLLTSSEVHEQKSVANLVEFHSGTIPRVVGSTMAAESAALSTAIDRHLYVRLLIEALLMGEPEYGTDWRKKLKIPGTLVTDAKSLFDHLHKTGSIPKERQTLIDLLAARDLMESDCLTLKWVPTSHMLADVLTKVMAPPEVCQCFLKTGLYATIPTGDAVSVEARLKANRQGQRERRKERKKALKMPLTTT